MIGFHVCASNNKMSRARRETKREKICQSQNKSQTGLIVGEKAHTRFLEGKSQMARFSKRFPGNPETRNNRFGVQMKEENILIKITFKITKGPASGGSSATSDDREAQPKHNVPAGSFGCGYRVSKRNGRSRSSRS